MIADVTTALDGWTQAVPVKTVTETTVNFEPTQTVTVTTIHAVVQPAQPATLRALDLDFAEAYQTLHTESLLTLGQFVEVGGADYRVVRVQDWRSTGGYLEAVAVATRKALLEATP